MRQRKALSLLIGLVVTCLVCCLVVNFVAIPRARDAFQTAMADAISTELGTVIGGTDATIAPGTYEIVASDILDQVNVQLAESSATEVQKLVFTITPDRVSMGFETQGQTPVVSGRLTVVDGRLKVADIESSGGIFEFLLPASTILGGLEQGFNQYLDQHGLTLVSVTQGDGVLTVVIE
jgi:hypothetical protein